MLRIIFIVFGIFFLLIGIVGLFLPVVPQIPFLLIGLLFLSAGSKRFKNKVFRSNIFKKHGKKYIKKYKILQLLLLKGELVNMKVLIVNGSPRSGGNTSIALDEMKKLFDSELIEYEELNIGNESIRGCVACGSCNNTGKCVFDDTVNKAASIFEECDGLVIASPVYYASANGTLISFLDRLFCSTNFDKSMKVGCSVCCARRAGTSATFDELNKYFTISNMPVVPSLYWNNIHGGNKGEATSDLEGLQTMRILASNMVFLMKSIKLGKEKYGLPKLEKRIFTNFINNR